MEKVSIKVADTGIGIPSDQLPKIFDRFYQVDSSATRHYGGTGIGLSLVKELVVLMGGSIETESLPGRGTTFIIHVPLKVSRQHAASENFLKGVPILIDSKKALSDISSEKPLILVVEDNIELQSFLSDNLGDESAVIAASDGMEAWDIKL